MSWFAGATDNSETLALPPGCFLELPGRGTTFVRDSGPRAGEGPALVLLHGLGATCDLNWFCAYPSLASHFRVIGFDLRGHGNGIRTDRFSLEDCADDVVALADVLGVDRFVPVGYSMGGTVAQLVWHRHPERVAGLVLCATSRNFRGKPRDQLMFNMMGLLQAPFRGPVVRLFGSACGLVFSQPLRGRSLQTWGMEQLSHSDWRSVMQAADAVGRFSSHDWVGDIDVPTAVVVTSRDRVVPVNRQMKLAGAIRNATAHIYAADHNCVTSGDPFVEILLSACDAVMLRLVPEEVGFSRVMPRPVHAVRAA